MSLVSVLGLLIIMPDESNFGTDVAILSVFWQVASDSVFWKNRGIKVDLGHWQFEVYDGPKVNTGFTLG
jgi:hypothetical protein